MKEEILEQIAERVPPGDNWRLFIDKTTVVEGLVQALTNYLRKTGFKGEYRLDPLGGSSMLSSLRMLQNQNRKFGTYTGSIKWKIKGYVLLLIRMMRLFF